MAYSMTAEYNNYYTTGSRNIFVTWSMMFIYGMLMY